MKKVERVFLTGVTGLVGSSVVVALVKAGRDFDFVCLVRNGGGQTAAARAEAAIRAECAFEGCPELADEVLSHVSVVAGDVASLDPEAVAQDPALAGVTKIFHCAADVNLGKDPTGKVFRTNFDGTKKVVALAQLLKVKEFHYVATAYVAGKIAGVAYEKGHDLSVGFNNPYEESKCRAEWLVRECGIPFTIYRPAIIVGRKKDGRIRRPLAFYRILEFLKVLKEHAARRQKKNPADWINMDMNCAAVASSHIYFVPIDYVQDAISELFLRPAVGDTYHVTGDTPVTANEILEATCGFLRIKGLTIGADTGSGNAEERLFTKFVGDLYPYFSSDITFHQEKIRRDWPECSNRTYGPDDLRVMAKAYFEDEFKNVPWVQEIVQAS